MKRKIVSIILILILLLSVMTSCIAVTQSDITAMQNKVNSATKQQNAVKAEKETILNEIADLDASISEYEVEISTLNSKIKTLQTKIDSKGKEIKQLQKEFDELQALLTDRLVAIYQEGQISFLDVLLSAESVWDYITMPTRIQELTQADNAEMEKVEKQRQVVEKAQKELEEQNNELKSAKKTVESKQKQLQVAKDSKQTKVNSLTAEQKKLQNQINSYNKAIREMEAQIKAAMNASQGIYQGSFSGKLSWPLSRSSRNYNVITSYFGYRVAPVAGATSNHNGIDIGVYSGTPVYAAADGYVILSEYNMYGRGKYVVIKHADNLYTAYQHLQSYSVSRGQYVKRGQQIALSGNTGVGSGPHLHFEVRVGPNEWSDLVDPLNYTHW